MTGEHSQVVVMTIPPGGEIGEEVHDHVDQLLVAVDGECDAVLDGVASPMRPTQLASGACPGSLMKATISPTGHAPPARAPWPTPGIS